MQKIRQSAKYAISAYSRFSDMPTQRSQDSVDGTLTRNIVFHEMKSSANAVETSILRNAGVVSPSVK